MKIVIDIPEDQYTTLNAKTQNDVTDVIDHGALIKAIKNGTPLPRGHGRLIDANILRKEVSLWGLDDYTPEDFIDEIDNAPTIIEADKE